MIIVQPLVFVVRQPHGVKVTLKVRFRFCYTQFKWRYPPRKHFCHQRTLQRVLHKHTSGKSGLSWLNLTIAAQWSWVFNIKSHRATARRHLARPLTYHKLTASSVHLVLEKMGNCQKAPCCSDTHSFSHMHTAVQLWQMTGTRQGAATRSHVPGVECCLQPINQ